MTVREYRFMGPPAASMETRDEEAKERREAVASPFERDRRRAELLRREDMERASCRERWRSEEGMRVERSRTWEFEVGVESVRGAGVGSREAQGVHIIIWRPARASSVERERWSRPPRDSTTLVSILRLLYILYSTVHLVIIIVLLPPMLDVHWQVRLSRLALPVPPADERHQLVSPRIFFAGYGTVLTTSSSSSPSAFASRFSESGIIIRLSPSTLFYSRTTSVSVAPIAPRLALSPSKSILRLPVLHAPRGRRRTC